MTVAFVLITVKSGSETIPDVKKKVDEIPEVVEAYAVFGSRDVIAKIETEEMSDLTQIVQNKIRSIDSVEKTETLTVWDEDFEQ